MAPSLGGDASDVAFIMITYAVARRYCAAVGRLSDRSGRRFAAGACAACEFCRPRCDSTLRYAVSSLFRTCPVWVGSWQFASSDSTHG